MTNDLEFLQELRENVALSLSDITRYEMALTMIGDWIDELRKINDLCEDCGGEMAVSKTCPVCLSNMFNED